MPARTAAEVGQFVREQRKIQGLTQADLATKAGVSRDWLVRLEQGHHRLELGLVMAITEALGFGVTFTAVQKSANSPLDAMLSNAMRDR